MVKHWEDGYDVVHTIKVSERKKSLTKKIMRIYFIEFLTQTKVKLLKCSDFKLISKKIVDISKIQ